MTAALGRYRAETVVQRDGAWNLDDALARLRSAGVRVGVTVLVEAGYRDENQLTNLVFWTRHPEMVGRSIDPALRELVRDWLDARDTVVRPALARRHPATPPPGSPRRPDGPTPAPSSQRSDVSSEQLGAFGSEEATIFRRRVFDEQRRRKLAQKKEYFPGLPESQIDPDPVDGSERLHVEAAPDCRQLLQSARADLEAQQASGDRLALRVTRIGVGSAYRDPARDLAAWKNAFAKHYGRTADERAAAVGGPHGDAAVAILVKVMVKKKAVPGFSNHTRGRAVDLVTTQAGVSFGPNSDQTTAWLDTWLHRWLRDHAGAHHIQPCSEEPWHRAHD